MNNTKSTSDKSFLLNIIYKKHNMNTLDPPEYTINKENTEYFVNLIRITLADDVITTKEMELLHRISKKLGFTIAETDQLIKATIRSEYNPPSELRKRFEQVFEIINMTLADGSMDKSEMRLASSFAAKCGFNEIEIPSMIILLVNGIKNGKNKTTLFEEYQFTLKK